MVTAAYDVTAGKYGDGDARKVALIGKYGEELYELIRVKVGELEYGIKKSRDPIKTRYGVYQFLAGIRVLSFDSEAARHFGDIFGDLEMKHIRISDRDTMIAAHARPLGYTLLQIVQGNFQEFKA